MFGELLCLHLPNAGWRWDARILCAWSSSGRSRGTLMADALRTTRGVEGS